MGSNPEKGNKRVPCFGNEHLSICNGIGYDVQPHGANAETNQKSPDNHSVGINCGLGIASLMLSGVDDKQG